MLLLYENNGLICFLYFYNGQIIMELFASTNTSRIGETFFLLVSFTKLKQYYVFSFTKWLTQNLRYYNEKMIIQNRKMNFPLVGVSLYACNAVTMIYVCQWESVRGNVRTCEMQRNSVFVSFQSNDTVKPFRSLRLVHQPNE